MLFHYGVTSVKMYTCSVLDFSIKTFFGYIVTVHTGLFQKSLFHLKSNPAPPIPMKASFFNFLVTL